MDYIGLGPYRFTNTKNKLSPILGLEGFQNIMDRLSLAGVGTPVYAIGGIQTKDFEELLKTGIKGMAVSGLFQKETLENIKHIIDTTK